MDTSQLHILTGWAGMLGGAVSGAIIGLFFHSEQWAGGYGSFRRRLLRLGHIAFFGIGFLNLMFGFTLQFMAMPVTYAMIASWGFLLAMVAMPLCCFLTAWHKPLRHLFPVPAIATLVAIIAVLAGGFAS
jgi:hypothetical protein